MNKNYYKIINLGPKHFFIKKLSQEIGFVSRIIKDKVRISIFKSYNRNRNNILVTFSASFGTCRCS